MDERLEALEELGRYVAGHLGRELLESEIRHGELMITVRRDAIVRVLSYLCTDANCLWGVAKYPL